MGESSEVQGLAGRALLSCDIVCPDILAIMGHIEGAQHFTSTQETLWYKNNILLRKLES